MPAFCKRSKYAAISFSPSSHQKDLEYSDLGPVDARKSPRTWGDWARLVFASIATRASNSPMIGLFFIVLGISRS